MAEDHQDDRSINVPTDQGRFGSSGPLPAPEDVLDFSLLHLDELDGLAAAAIDPVGGSSVDADAGDDAPAGRRRVRSIGLFAYGAFVAAVGSVLLLEPAIRRLSTSVAVAAIVASMAILAATVSGRVSTRPGPG